ncbi:hypothetical protein TGGT1_259168 [Toxoplasma gondii GT1]|uniref:AAA+ ATPase domain-containing protein n=2 Tax=Toxoplasma gondii TaxID=5811 RepID=S7WEP8_TOXGG|nr:hypothetical protein TGGT1_259168 [Toxoplasma gondii GT1]KAF4641273.1 hypothetical protein TGRH88_070830 [Toxoplasma gondii]
MRVFLQVGEEEILLSSVSLLWPRRALRRQHGASQNLSSLRAMDGRELSFSLASLLQNAGEFHKFSSPFFLTVAADVEHPWAPLSRVRKEVLKISSSSPSSPSSPPSSSVSSSPFPSSLSSSSFSNCEHQRSASASWDAESGACCGHRREQRRPEGEVGRASLPGRSGSALARPEVYVQEVWSSDLWDRTGAGRSWTLLLRESLLKFLAAPAKTKVLLLVHPDVWCLPVSWLPASLPRGASPAAHASRENRGQGEACESAETPPGARLVEQLTEALRDQLEESDEEEREGEDGEEDEEDVKSAGGALASRRRDGARRRRTNQKEKLKELIEAELDNVFRWLQEALLLQRQDEESKHRRRGGSDLLAHALNFLAECDRCTRRSKPSWDPSLPSSSSSSPCSSLLSSSADRVFVIGVLRMPLRSGSVFQRAFPLHFPLWRISRGSDEGSGHRRLDARGRPGRRHRDEELVDGRVPAEATRTGFPDFTDRQESEIAPEQKAGHKDTERSAEGDRADAKVEEREEEDDDDTEEDEGEEADEEDEDEQMERYREAALGAVAALAEERILECEENWDEVLRWMLQGTTTPSSLAADPEGPVRGTKAEDRQTSEEGRGRTADEKVRGERGRGEEETRGVEEKRREGEETRQEENRRQRKLILDPGDQSWRDADDEAQLEESSGDSRGYQDLYAWIPEDEENDILLDSRERRILNLWKQQAGLGPPQSGRQSWSYAEESKEHPSSSLPSVLSPRPASHSASSSTSSSRASSSSSPSDSASASSSVSSSPRLSSSASCTSSLIGLSASSSSSSAFVCPSSAHCRSCSAFALLPPPPLFASFPGRPVRAGASARAQSACRDSENCEASGVAEESRPRVSSVGLNAPPSCLATAAKSRRRREGQETGVERAVARESFLFSGSASGDSTHLTLFEQILRRRGLAATHLLPPHNVQMLLRVPLNEETPSARGRDSCPTSEAAALSEPRPEEKGGSDNEMHSDGRFSSTDLGLPPRLATVRAPRAVLICGPAGSGKTTLLHALGQLWGQGFGGERVAEASGEPGEKKPGLRRRRGGGGENRTSSGGGAIHTHVGDLLQAVVGGSQRALLNIFVKAAGTNPHAAVCIEGLDAALGIRGELWQAEDEPGEERRRKEEEEEEEEGQQEKAKERLREDRTMETGNSQRDKKEERGEADEKEEERSRTSSFSSEESSDVSSYFEESPDEDSPAQEVQRSLAQFFVTLVGVYVHHIGVPLICTVSIHPESLPPEIMRCFQQVIVLRPIHFCLADTPNC